VIATVIVIRIIFVYILMRERGDSYDSYSANRRIVSILYMDGMSCSALELLMIQKSKNDLQSWKSLGEDFDEKSQVR